LKREKAFLYLRCNKEQEFKMKIKKYMVPVTWQMSTYVEVEACGPEEAAHEAAGVDISIDSVDSWEYVGDSWEVDEEGIEEVPTPLQAGDHVMWNDPDDGICSGPAIFKRMAEPSSLVAIIEKDGVEMECFVDELS
jgi:hypothetical protein